MFFKNRSARSADQKENSNKTVVTVDDRADRINFVVRDINRLYDQVTALGSPICEPVLSLLASAGTIIRDDLNNLSKLNSPAAPALTPMSRELLIIALTELGLELKN